MHWPALVACSLSSSLRIILQCTIRSASDVRKQVCIAEHISVLQHSRSRQSGCSVGCPLHLQVAGPHFGLGHDLKLWSWGAAGLAVRKRTFEQTDSVSKGEWSLRDGGQRQQGLFGEAWQWCTIHRGQADSTQGEQGRPVHHSDVPHTGRQALLLAASCNIPRWHAW